MKKPIELKISEILKSRREQKRFSLHSVHQETKISLAYLEAMEAGQWDHFPAEVYLLGFLRKYALYLGLNPEDMIQIYKKERQAVISLKEEETKGRIEVAKKNESVSLIRGAVLVLFIMTFG